MDYGYQLLRHVVQQVFGNLVRAAQLTLAPVAVPAALFYWFLSNSGSNADSAPNVAAAFLMIPLLMCGVFWAAVGWHRYVLLEEAPLAIVPPLRFGRIMAYLFTSLFLGLLVLPPLVVLIMAVVSMFGEVPAWFATSVSIAASWLFVRLGLVLPAAALGERFMITDSWRATRPVSGQILLPIFVFSAIPWMINSGLGAVATPSTALLVLSSFVGWLQLLLNLALLTTLYGNLVQGRALN